MAQTYLSRFLGTMRSLEDDLSVFFDRLAGDVTFLVQRAANADGIIPPQQAETLRTAIGQRVTSAFLVATPDGQAAFTVRSGVVIPQSAYFRTWWPRLQELTGLAVEQQAADIRQRLQGAPDVLLALQRARRNPFTWAQQVTEQQVFKPDPFAQYEPPHTWVDPNGYRLSDRIWRIAGEIRRRIDLLLSEQIGEGRAAFDMARELEQFLQPGRQLIRTNKPYGTDASYDAMRLARTEVTRAFSRSAEMSANANPFVQGLSVALSRSHPKLDICDEAADAGPWPKDAIPDRYRIPLHPHCLCHYRFEVIENPAGIIAAARAEIQAGRSLLVDLVGPLLEEQFSKMLLSGAEFIFPPDPLPYPA